MKPFRDYFAFSDFQAIYQHNQDRGEIDDAWRDKNDILEEPFIRALHNFLMDYHREKGLSPVENSDTHSTNFSHFWNAYLEGIDEKNEWHEIAYNLKSLVGKSFHSTIFFANTNKEKNANKSEPEIMQETYEKAVSQIDKGDFAYYELPSENYCFNCGGRYVQKIDGWKISLFTQHFGEKWTDRSTFTPAEPCHVENTVEKTIEFKTGDLILTDWFRLPAFTGMVDNEEHEKMNFDVNCVKGRSDQAQYYLEKFNFICVPAWNDSYIFTHNEQLVFAPWASSMDDEHGFYDTYEEHGRVNKQLRALMIIERETLTGILMQSGLSEKEATKSIQEYLKENSYEIRTLKVSPGTYRFQFSGNPHLLKNHLQSSLDSTTQTGAEQKELLDSMPEDLTPYLIMKGIDLKPELKKKKKP